MHGFEEILKTVALPSCGQRSYLRDFFCFVRLIDSIVTRLDSSRRGAPFVCKALFLTPYGLKVVLIILKNVKLVLRGPGNRPSELHSPETAPHPTAKRTALSSNRIARVFHGTKIRE